jgi:alkaline phosphatase D
MAGVVASALATAAGCSGDDDDVAEPDPDSLAEDDLTAGSLPPLPTGLPAELFALGVASGDPRQDSVILWTRIVADPMAGDGGIGTAPIPVGWEVAEDESFANVVASGDAVADAALAHSVHVDALSLEPDTWYWYRFMVGDRTSPIGRTRTTPAPGTDPDSLRFAFASCQNRQNGYWTAHQHLADEDLDLVLFLGDYIYEEPPSPDAVQPYRSGAPTDLAGYRKRWGDYKADQALQAAHASFPWVCTWDDHEVANNYAADLPDGGDPDDPVVRESWLQRRAAAYQAYYEHLPLRLDQPSGADFPIHRELTWGQLARFFVLDGRQYRSPQVCQDTTVLAGAGPLCEEAEDDARTMLGTEQEEWLADGLASSEARWNVLAQQTVMTSVPFVEGVFNLDQWDGYPAARRRLVERLGQASNPVIVTGDIHLSGVGVVTADPDDPETEPVATELVGTSVSSEFPLPDVVEVLAETMPNVHYINARQRGYVVCAVTTDELRAEFRFVSTATEPNGELETGAAWVIADGDPVPHPA